MVYDQRPGTTPSSSMTRRPTGEPTKHQALRTALSRNSHGTTNVRVLPQALLFTSHYSLQLRLPSPQSAG